MVDEIVEDVGCHWECKDFEAFSVSDEPFVLVFVILPDSALVFDDSPKYNEKHD